jgi:hypothetical protein
MAAEGSDHAMRHQTNKWIRRSPVDAAALERLAQLLSEKAGIPISQARKRVRAQAISARRGIVGLPPANSCKSHNGTIT